jgi:putative cell wall-binding protein
MRKIFQMLTTSFLALLIISPGKVIAQTDTTKKEVATYSPLIEFVSVQKSDNSVDLKTSVKAKINGALIKLGGLKIEFTSSANSAE